MSPVKAESATLYLSVLKKDLPLGLDLLAEVLLHPAFPAEEIARKIGEIQAGLRRSEQNPGTVAGRALGPLMFPAHPYGRPSAGTIESVGRLTREQVVGFYRTHYRPDGAVIVAVGDITVAEIRQALVQRLTPWTSPGGVLPAIPKPAAAVTAETRTITRDLSQTTVLLGRPYAWGLAVGGQAGVEAVIRQLAGELDLTMALAGARTVADVDRSFVA